VESKKTQPNKKMKKTSSSISAPVAGITNNNLIAKMALSVLLLGGAIAYGQVPDSGAVPVTTNVTNDADAVNPGGNATNTPLAQIQGGLDKIKQEITAAVTEMAKANAATPAQQMQKVQQLAAQLRQLGTNELGDSSDLAANADRLIVKMKSELAQARERSSDPNVGARQIYRDVADKLEPQLSKLIDARSSLSEVRAQLLQKADLLDQDAAAIGFADAADQDIIAAQAFQKVLGDTAKFAEQIQKMIDNVTQIPIT
jgi:hypothetical protein